MLVNPTAIDRDIICCIGQEPLYDVSTRCRVKVFPRWPRDRVSDTQLENKSIAIRAQDVPRGISVGWPAYVLFAFVIGRAASTPLRKLLRKLVLHCLYMELR